MNLFFRAVPLLAVVGLGLSVRAQKVPDVRLDTETAPGTTMSGASTVAALGTTVFAVWQEGSSDSFSLPSDLYFKASLDAGRTWPPTGVRINTGSPALSAMTLDAQLVVEGSSLYVTWRDNRDGTWGVYFNRSLDGGTTWLVSDIRLDERTTPGLVDSSPQMAASGSAVCVTWSEKPDGDVLLNRSLDGGTTWLPTPYQLDTGIGGGYAADPTIATSGNWFYVSWWSALNGYADVYVSRSADYGNTWPTDAVRVDTGDPVGASNALYPKIAASGPFVSVVWEDYRWSTGGPLLTADIYFNGSVDNATRWLPGDVRLDTGDAPGAFDSQDVQVAASGSSVHVVWEDARLGVPYFWSIYGISSPDGGLTWPTSDQRIDSYPGPCDDPKIAASANVVGVTWVTLSGVYFNRSTDGGTTWGSNVRLDSTPSGAYPFAGSIAVSGSAVHVGWTDQRNGLADVFSNIPFGFQPYGTGTSGSSGIVPALSGSGLSVYAQPVTLNVAGGLGGAAGLLILAFGGPAVIPALGGTLLVGPPIAPIPLALGGSTGLPGVGSASFPILIPDNPSLVGLRINAQGLFFDAGATAGVSMTNGLELWIG